MMAKPIGFTATATPTLDYLHHDKGGALTAERVDWAENVNCMQDSAEETERMWAQLVEDAPELKRQAGGSSRGRRLEKPYGQYVWSWHPDDNPSREHIRDTVADGMKKLGLAQCQYRIVVHRDTDHVHAHVIVCRVHPEHGRAMGRKNDGDRLREWSLEYEKAQGRIRVPGRLDDLTHRRRHAREKRAGQEPTPASDARKKRRRERRHRRRRTRDAIGRPVIHTQAERQEWATLLESQPAQSQTAELKRQQTRRRIEGRRERNERSKPLAAAAAVPPIQLRPAPERPPVRHGRTVAGPSPAAPPMQLRPTPEPRPARPHRPAAPPMQLRPTPERPRARPGRTVAGPSPAAPPMQLRPTPERPRARPGRTVAGPSPAAPPMQLRPAPERPAPEPEREAERREREHAAAAATEERARAAELRTAFEEAAGHARAATYQAAKELLTKRQPAGLPWRKVDAELVASHGTDPRYAQRIDIGQGITLHAGELRVDLEDEILEHAKERSPHRVPPAKSIQSAVDGLMSPILNKVLPDRVRDPAPAAAQEAAAARAPERPAPDPASDPASNPASNPASDAACANPTLIDRPGDPNSPGGAAPLVQQEDHRRPRNK